MTDTQYNEFIRTRITELRMKKNVSEHRMSLDLGRSGSYIRGITCESSMPSLKELFNIITYFNMTPVEFFAPLENEDSTYSKLCQRLKELDDTDLDKVNTFVGWITDK